ncbi:MAG: PKD domain-containing protein [Gammaproteobacteria bacterium]
MFIKRKLSTGFLRTVIFLPLAIYLAGCDSDSTAADTSAIVRIIRSGTEGVVPFTVTFSPEVENTRIFSGTWDFGDGTPLRTSLGTDSISHTYFEPGVYTATATFDADRVSVELSVYEVQLTALLTDPGLGGGGGGGGDDEDPDVNLVVTSFAIDNETTPGGFETVSAIIQNIGTGPLGGEETSGLISVGYYLSEDQEITIDDILIGDTTILVGTSFSLDDVDFGTQELSPQENYQYDHQLAVKGNVPPGVYYAGAIVDIFDEYDWYDFPRSTDTNEYMFPQHIRVPETNEDDNARLLSALQVTVVNNACVDDVFEGDDTSATATFITVGTSQVHNFCRDNADWYQFDAVEGGIYKITTSLLGTEADTQLILYDRDGESILLFHDNVGNGDGGEDGLSTYNTPCGVLYTVDFECGWPIAPDANDPLVFALDTPSEIVWEAHQTGRYFIKARLTQCDEDKDLHCGGDALIPPPLSLLSTNTSPDGVGLNTEYTLTLTREQTLP